MSFVRLLPDHGADLPNSSGLQSQDLNPECNSLTADEAGTDVTGGQGSAY